MPLMVMQEDFLVLQSCGVPQGYQRTGVSPWPEQGQSTPPPPPSQDRGTPLMAYPVRSGSFVQGEGVPLSCPVQRGYPCPGGGEEGVPLS